MHYPCEGDYPASSNASTFVVKTVSGQPFYKRRDSLLEIIVTFGTILGDNFNFARQHIETNTRVPANLDEPSSQAIDFSNNGTM